MPAESDHYNLVIVIEIAIAAHLATLARKLFLNSSNCTEIAFLVGTGEENIGGQMLTYFDFKYLKNDVEVETRIYAENEVRPIDQLSFDFA